MSELFGPPGTPWRGVSPKLGQARRGVLAVFGLPTLVVLYFLPRLLSGPWVSGPDWLPLVLVAGGLLGLGWGWWLIGRQVHYWGYAEREEDLYVRHGALVRRLVAVPYGRMQYVDVQAGPLDQLLGIAKVHLHTASPNTSAVIPGLPNDEAARLRDRLTALGEVQASGL